MNERIKVIKKQIAYWIMKDKYIILVSLIIGTAITLGVSISSYANGVSANISDSIIRLHVLANSDLENDQNLKLFVRDKILETYNEKLSGFSDIEMSREYILSNLDDIRATAQAAIKEQGFDYDVRVTLQKQTQFPTKNYADISVPAGQYEALRIEIGSAQGQNWWCVMFPPLCFVDGTYSELSDETKEKLRQSLGEEEFNLVTQSDEKVSYKLKFKIVEIWQKISSS